jgi:hypothetical protein
MIRKLRVALLATAILSGCATIAPYYDLGYNPVTGRFHDPAAYYTEVARRQQPDYKPDPDDFQALCLHARGDFCTDTRWEREEAYGTTANTAGTLGLGAAAGAAALFLVP